MVLADNPSCRLQALEKLEKPSEWAPYSIPQTSNQSHTEALILRLQLEKEQQAQVRNAPPQQDLYRLPPPLSHLHTTEHLGRTADAPVNLNVRCTVSERGATAYVSWEPLSEAWAPAVQGRMVAFEVQMIVRWISSQTWNTIFTVTEPNCSVKGLKSSYPFAVRVRAIAGNWASDFTRPFEFVTEKSQGKNTVPAAFVKDTQEGLSENKSVGHSSKQLQPSPLIVNSTYLERVLKARQEKAEFEAQKLSSEQQQQQQQQQTRPTGQILSQMELRMQPPTSSLLTANAVREYRVKEGLDMRGVAGLGDRTQQQRVETTPVLSRVSETCVTQPVLRFLLKLQA